MTDKLPPNLLQLFVPRPPIRYLPPQDDAPESRAAKASTISGLGAFLGQLEEYKQADDYEPTESWIQKRDRIRHEKHQAASEMASEKFSGYKPDDDPKVKGDPLRTLFVGRLSYDVKESDLEREFGRFGPIERIRIVRDERSDKPKKPSKGYAFVVFEREKDLKAAYKEAEAPRIKDRRCIVDVERGRTVPGWRPRRFGGGLGGRGYTKAAPSRPVFGAGPGGYAGGPGGFQDRGFRGGFQGGRGGGFRGGFRGDRGGYGGRGGIGYQGGGNGGGFGGGRPPAGAPSGPGGGRGGYGGSGGYDDRRNGYSGGRDRGPGGGRDRYDERDRYGGGRRDDGYESRKRHYEGDQYDDRSKRRY